ncbi:hypothetical protein [Chryseobacterium jejuense]|uniref:hypothetical protein n=1 Tax=Chryseobacterium jejuense TaxID=445960 RepID=UPI001AEA58FB|nr:hypothetical protein [Chryseobacterium jejuense]MBP2619652.1 hypothetical protein [Chryseobacterium jejuense]
MRNIIFTIILLFPLVLTSIILSKVTRIDSNLKLMRVQPVLKDNNRERIIIDKHASKRRIYFYIADNNSKIIKYERDYRGFISDWSILFNNNKLETNSTISFYSEVNQKSKSEDSIPFFSINNEKKNFSYYFDIFQYIKNQYFFLLLIVFFIYAFIGGGGIDRFGGITQYKTIGILFALDIAYFLLLLFW